MGRGAACPTLSPIHLTSVVMASVLTNVAIYDQFDFIPDSLLSDFATSGYSLKPVFEWLAVPETWLTQ